MRNSLSVSARDIGTLAQTDVKISVEEKDGNMSVKEVADVFGVSPEAIKRVVRKIFPNKMQNGKPTYLDEREVACISKEMKTDYHAAQPTNQVCRSEITTELEVLANYKAANDAFIALLQQKNAELTKINAEQRPKAIVYDKICNAEGLKPVDQVASNLGFGKNTFFSLLRGMGIFFYSAKDSEGRRTNLPKREYTERGYFVTKEEPYRRGDKDCLYTKIYVTGKGEAWLAGKLRNENGQED